MLEYLNISFFVRIVAFVAVATLFHRDFQLFLLLVLRFLRDFQLVFL